VPTCLNFVLASQQAVNVNSARVTFISLLPSNETLQIERLADSMNYTAYALVASALPRFAVASDEALWTATYRFTALERNFTIALPISASDYWRRKKYSYIVHLFDASNGPTGFLLEDYIPYSIRVISAVAQDSLTMSSGNASWTVVVNSNNGDNDPSPLIIPIPLIGVTTWYATTSLESIFAQPIFYVYNMSASNLVFNATANMFIDNTTGITVQPVARNGPITYNYNNYANFGSYYTHFLVFGTVSAVQTDAVGEGAQAPGKHASLWRGYNFYANAVDMNLYAIRNFSTPFQSQTKLEDIYYGRSDNIQQGQSGLVASLSTDDNSTLNRCGSYTSLVAFGNGLFQLPSLLVVDNTAQLALSNGNCDLPPTLSGMR
jgi:hypothetical protein